MSGSLFETTVASERQAVSQADASQAWHQESERQIRNWHGLIGLICFGHFLRGMLSLAPGYSAKKGLQGMS